jgi:hypothetical protein
VIAAITGAQGHHFFLSNFELTFFLFFLSFYLQKKKPARGKREEGKETPCNQQKLRMADDDFVLNIVDEPEAEHIQKRKRPRVGLL